MKIVKFNISKPEKYIKDGVEKTYWANVGTYTEFEKQDGSISRLVEIPAIGLKANVYPIEKVERQPQPIQPKKELYEVLGDENIDDIPF